MNIKIISAELGLATCSREQIPEGAFKSNTLIFFYYPKRDWIVFNEDHSDHTLFLELTQAYMELEDHQRKVFLDQVDIESLRKAFVTLNFVMRIRRKRYRRI